MPEAVEFSCHLVLIAEVTPDGETALQEGQRRAALALLCQQHPEPVRHPGQWFPGIVGRQLDRTLQPPPSRRKQRGGGHRRRASVVGTGLRHADGTA